MRHVRLMVLLVLSLTLVMGCNFDDLFSSSDSDDKPSETQTGTLKMLLTDAPGKFDEVNVTFSEIAVHLAGDTSEDGENGENGENGDGGENGGNGGEPTEKAAGEWITITVGDPEDPEEPLTYNLLELSNGVTAVLSEEELEVGHYTQIRIVILDANVKIGDNSYPLTIPSGTLKFVCGFDIESGKSTELIVDFDAARSVHTTGNTEDYKLTPTIRIVHNVKCGWISGHVTNPENNPVASAISNGKIVTETNVNTDGNFTLSFLKEGTYTVSIVDDLGQSYSSEEISVTAGSIYDLGEITLK